MNIDLNTINRIYFLGIGGIGMSAVARYFDALGKEVSGYDRTATKLTKKLESLGMKIHYDENPNLIPTDIDMVVWTPALSDDNLELQAIRKMDVPLLKRSEVLGLISQNTETIAIAGTHGKTTTTAILSYLLEELGAKPSAFVGGILSNYSSNCIINDNQLMIVEADEYDRSFLRLEPDVAVILSLDHDHSDIYKGENDLVNAFKEFTLKISADGSLWIADHLKEQLVDTWLDSLKERGVSVKTFGIESGDVCAKNIEVIDGQFNFDIQYKSEESKVKWDLPGEHNISNATVAFGICAEKGYKLKEIAKALAGFKGIQRRFEVHKLSNGRVLIDDYAHHPNEVKAAISATKRMFVDEKITLIFQPHLFSRTNDFYKEFAKEFEEMDEVILLPIYPAREEPMEGVSSELILNNMSSKQKRIVQKERIVAEIDKIENRIILMLGAGDIDKEIDKIIEKHSIDREIK